MQTEIQNPDLNPNRVPLIVNQSTGQCRHLNNNQNLLFLPCSSAAPFGSNIIPPDLSVMISERKLWQTLVIPLVLGCIIFLVVVWTRQISLLVVNDTIVMIIIFGALFMFMLSIAFWLAQSQHLEESSLPSVNTNDTQQAYPNQHQTDNSDHCQSPGSASSSSQKHHCTVSIIDYSQPPDYYSAMRNSFPVALYTQDDLDFKKLQQSHLTDDQKEILDSSSSSTHTHSQLSFTSPPSYDELN